LLFILCRLAAERLTRKQKAVLEFVSREENEGKTSYRIVNELSKELGCSRAILYNSINSLQKFGLVRRDSGKCLELTSSGRILVIYTKQDGDYHEH